MINQTANAILSRSRRWFYPGQRASTIWLGKYCVAAAWLGLSLAVISPPHGSGVGLCWFHSCTGLPCPGCGMTRSLSCGIRGMFRESWEYHPMGLFVLALFVVTAGQSLLPKLLRDRLVRFIEASPKVFNTLYLVFLILFIAFGTARALLHLGDLASIR